jgi:hypothetical protein
LGSFGNRDISARPGKRRDDGQLEDGGERRLVRPTGEESWQSPAGSSKLRR